MKLSTRRRLQRRDLLKWIGGAALALPTLELFELPARAQTAKQAKFCVFVYTNDGMHPPAFFPAMGSTDPTASATLSPLAMSPGGNNHKSQALLLGAPVDGTGFPLLNTGLTYNIQPAQHRPCQCLTASKVRMSLNAGQGDANNGPSIVNKSDGPSMDYVIARHYNQNPLLLAMRPCGGDTPSEVTFDESGNPLTRLYQAPNIYSVVFGGVMPGGMAGAPDPTAMAKQQALTNLNSSFSTLRPQLSAYDKTVLDQHLTQLSAYEQEASSRLLGSPTGAGAGCTGPAASTVPAPQQDGSEVQPLSKFIMQTVATAFRCDMYKVATVSFGYPGGGGVGGLRMPWLGFDDPQHAVSHNGGNSVAIGKYSAMNKWTISQLAILMDQLKAIPTAGGTLLDETVIYLFNRHGDGRAHTNYAVVGILAGGAGGYFKTGQNFVMSKPVSPTDVLISVASSMGVAVPQFPLPTFMGVPCPSANGPFSSTTELTAIKA